MPVRVTATFSEGFHRAVQALRGYLLQEEGLDLSYSTVVEMLSKFGVLSFITREGKAESRLGIPILRISKSDQWVVLRSAEEPYQEALYSGLTKGEGEFPEGEIAAVMLPHLIKAAREEIRRRDPQLYKSLVQKWDAEEKKERKAAAATASPSKRPEFDFDLSGVEESGKEASKKP